MALSFIAFNSCSEEDTLSDNIFNYVTFGASSYATGVDVNGTATVEVEVLTSQSSGSARTFSVSVDPTSTAAAGSYTVPSTVTVPAGSQVGILPVELSDVDLGIGINSLIINFMDEEGLFVGDGTTIDYTQNCEEVNLTLDLVFHDAWPQEASWEIQDSLGGVVASAAVGTYAGMTSATETVTICGGRDFTFILNDDFSDGGHSYTLTLNGVVKAEVTAPYSYTDSISVEFDTK